MKIKTKSESVPETGTDELTLLYQRARMEWDERLGNIVSLNHKLIIISVVALIVAALSVVGVIYIGSRSKIEPYVFAMSDSQLVALQAAKNLPKEERKRLEISQLHEFVTNVRSVFTDINAQREYVLKAYAHLRSTDPAFVQVNTYLSQTAPPNIRAETEVVTVQVDNILPIGDGSMTYQIEWTENITDRQGKSKPPLRFKAAVEIYYEVPSTPKEFMGNPTGLWVKSFNVTERF
ncbi:conjugal transfer protein TrbF [Shewanella sp. 4t3-1-2LB]|uniref:VirB8/TrbF family protein n=1 Tax=Shewanella sp. 4t3-1-2LB TaxID=2817682 RepID=UPI001A990974|nr:VirB8/TrbF family protein [Shewanella sp. 4t3-1-2LB]MBO1272895.1 conjugal transfer protein TrbF [Shewanella sp. 4t3-1-2LB]